MGHFRSIPRGRAVSVIPPEADTRTAGVYEHTPLAQLWKSIIADQATPVSRARADANRLRDDLQSKIDYLRTQIREIAAA
jgi:hypothetical protein